MTWEWFHLTLEGGKKKSSLGSSGGVFGGGKHFNLGFPKAEAVYVTYYLGEIIFRNGRKNWEK